MENTELLSAIGLMLKEQKQELQEQIKADIQEQLEPMKGDIVEMKGDIIEIKGDIVEMKGDITKLKSNITKINNNIENNMMPKINTMYDNYGYIVDKAKELKVSKGIAEDVGVLKHVVKRHSLEIDKLKKAR